MKENFTLKGVWELKTVDQNGNILQKEIVKNLIVNTGKTRISQLLNGVSSTYFRAIAIGTGTTGAVAGNSALETELTRSTATLSNGTYTAVYEHTFTFGSNYAITEAGIFDSATVSGSVMLNRTTFTAKNVSSTVKLIVTATITIASA